MDKDHVTLVNLKETPVSHVVSNGIVTTDGNLHEVDIIAIATGFDSLTGGFMEIDFEGVQKQSLQKKWNGERGAFSYLGMTVSGFPNMFYTYGPHAPTAYANGPSIVQPQSDWIADVCMKMRGEGKTKIDATPEAEESWKQTVDSMHSLTLRHNTDSWYMGMSAPWPLIAPGERCAVSDLLMMVLQARIFPASRSRFSIMREASRCI